MSPSRSSAPTSVVTFASWPLKGVVLEVHGVLDQGVVLDPDTLEQYSPLAAGLDKAAAAARKVTSLTMAGTEVSAMVPGSSGKSYASTLKIGPRILRGTCSCPVVLDCKHAGALAVLTAATLDVQEEAGVTPATTHRSAPAPRSRAGTLAASLVARIRAQDDPGARSALLDLKALVAQDPDRALDALVWALGEVLTDPRPYSGPFADLSSLTRRTALACQSAPVALERVIFLGASHLETQRNWLKEVFSRTPEAHQVVDVLYEVSEDTDTSPAAKALAAGLLAELAVRLVPYAELERLAEAGRTSTWSPLPEHPYHLL